MPSAETKCKLAEQRGFLSRSVQDFMDGHPAEALRIATTIRVLVHETGMSKPLLKHFRPDYRQLRILDRPGPEPINPGGKILFYVGIGVQIISGKGASPITDLSGPELQVSTIGEWWQRCCLIFTDASGQHIQFRRRDLLLTLANKEGGAHVDTSLPPNYERYVISSPMKVHVNGIATDSINLARYAAVEAAVQMIDALDRLI